MENKMSLTYKQHNKPVNNEIAYPTTGMRINQSQWRHKTY